MPAPSPPPSSSASSTPCCLLVTGASGNLGQRVLAHLLDTLGVAPCRLVAGSRTPERLVAFARRGVLTRWLDFRDAASVRAAAQGVDRVLLISVPDDDDDRVALHDAAVRALVATGMRHIVYTSFLHADRATAIGARDHRATERMIRGSGVRSFTFLRNSLYFDNHAVWIAGTGAWSGEWHSAAGRGRLAGIARDDAALAAATALASESSSQQIYELASSQGLTIDEIVATIAKAVGARIRVVHVSERELADEIVECTSVAPVVARACASLDGHIAAGLAEPPRDDDFFKLTGRHATTHSQWVEAHRALLLRVA